MIPPLQVKPTLHVTPPEAAVSKANPLRVLLAEDTPVLQKILTAQLRKLSHTPVLAADGLEVLQHLRQGLFDVVLMDLEMPGLDGIATTLRLRQEIPGPRQPAVIALTAHAIDTRRAELLALGFDDALSKPVKLYTLTKMLVRVPRYCRLRRLVPG